MEEKLTPPFTSLKNEGEILAAAMLVNMLRAEIRGIRTTQKCCTTLTLWPTTLLSCSECVQLWLQKKMFVKKTFSHVVLKRLLYFIFSECVLQIKALIMSFISWNIQQIKTKFRL